MMTPTRRCLWAGAVVFVCAIPLPWWPQLGTVWTALAGAVSGVALGDLVLSLRGGRITVRRIVRHNLPLNSWCDVKLLLHAGYTGQRVVEIFDHVPPTFDIDTMPVRFRLSGGYESTVSYRVRPRQRGDASFPLTECRICSALRFWQRRERCSNATAVKVYPDFAEISRYALLATENRLGTLGVRRRQRRGSGNEFHQLRDYRDGDSLRQIDWKATARYRRPIAREYQDERDQQVIFMLDCGRRMRHVDNGRMHMDEALNAALLLAWVSAVQGDSVGFLAFAGSDYWLPPFKGRGAVNRLLNQLYGISASSDAADYMQAATSILTRVRRRALIILITNTRDEDHDDLDAAVRMLSHRHLVILADLHESVLDETIAAPVTDLTAALRFHAVDEFLDSRHRQHELFRHHGALTLDVRPDRLPVTLVNQYLDVKRSGRL